MKKTVFVYIDEKSNSPLVYTSWEEAIEAVDQNIAYYAEKWGENDEAIIQARKEFEQSLRDRSKDWYGTYLGYYSFGFYVREIEFREVK